MNNQWINNAWSFFSAVAMHAIVLLLLIGLWGINKAYAISGLTIQIPVISSPYLTISGLSFNAEWLINQKVELKAQIDSVHLSNVDQKIDNVSFECKHAAFDGNLFSCGSGKLILKHEFLGRQEIYISFKYVSASSKFESHITNISIFGGQQKIHLNADAHSWQASFNGDINVSSLKPVVARYAPELDLQTVEGIVKAEAKAEGDSSGKYQLDLEISSKDISIENSDSSSGIYQASLDTNLLLQGDSSILEYDLNTVLRKAFVYFTHEISETEQHFYSYEPAEPINIDILGSYGLNDGQLSVDSAVIKQTGVMDLDVEAQIGYGDKIDLQSIIINVSKLQPGKVLSQLEYPVIPFLEKEKLTLLGMLSGSLTAKSPLSKQPEISSMIGLTDVSYSYDGQALGINGLSGVINWNSMGDARPSTISWDDGNFQLIPFDNSVLNFRLGSNSLHIDKFRLPTLGGKVVVDSVSVQELGSNIKEYKYDLGVRVEDINLVELTTALEWPEMQGVINASFPRVTFENDVIELDGSAKLKLFDGEMMVSNLAIEEPLGIVPRMRGDLEIYKLDLEELSSTLQFGRITGKLNGYARDIQLEQWFPVAMDMSLYTPDDDDTKRRISQKAVDFISDVGGVGGSLSRTYLRFFEEFSYDKIGINLQLEDGVCNITGIEPTGDGYYIVKGSFIPRIDIVGYESQVSWIELVEKIKGAIESGPATLN